MESERRLFLGNVSVNTFMLQITHVTTVINNRAIIEELLETVFSV
jgi:hypothetical protein